MIQSNLFVIVCSPVFTLQMSLYFCRKKMKVKYRFR